MEVNGGAELQCRQFAEKLAAMGKYDIEVLTTRAIDYASWKDEYRKGAESLNGVPVRRFSVNRPRVQKRFDRITRKVYGGNASLEEEERWMREQGPYSGSLFRYIRAHKDDYDVFVFFTYLYATTYFGLMETADKAVLVPDAHDEPPIYLKIFRKVFSAPRAIFYNTAEEQRFVQKLFHNEGIYDNGGRGGVGVDIPQGFSAERFRQKYHLDGFMLYIGRIDENKGCRELFRYFEEYRRRNAGTLKLVLMGKAQMEIPAGGDIISLGYVSDEDKFGGLAACKLLILPSRYESLSMVVLEAMQLGIPVLVNGKSPVLKGHCRRSNGGLYYGSYAEFEGCINYLLEHPAEYRAMGENGHAYVSAGYSWDAVMDSFLDVVGRVAELNKEHCNE